MKVFGKSFLSLAGLVGCLGFTAATASAQQATFTLPVEAHWGRAVLEPGDYKVNYPNAAEATPILRIAGNGRTVYVLLQTKTAERHLATEGKMVLVDVNGHYTVQSMPALDNEQTYLFPLPKNHEITSASPNPQKSTNIAVQIRKIAR